jgi:hypothetical protein
METKMAVEGLTQIFVGFFVLVSLALHVTARPIFVSEHFLWVTAFVGTNLFQSGFTRICALETVLGKFGLTSSGA